MTKKRFNVETYEDTDWVKDNGKTIYSKEIVELLNQLNDENEQLKQRINSRLHFYRELYDSTNDNIVKRVIEDLEDILR